MYSVPQKTPYEPHTVCDLSCDLTHLIDILQQVQSLLEIVLISSSVLLTDVELRQGRRRTGLSKDINETTGIF